MTTSVRRLLARIGVIGVLSVVVAQVVFFHVLYVASLDLMRGVAIVAAVACVLFIVSWFPLSEALAARSGRVSAVGLIIRGLASLAIGLIMIQVIPIEPTPIAESSIEVTALGTHQAEAKSSEVWVRLVVDGSPVPYSALATHGNWTERDGLAVSIPPNQPATLAWRGVAHVAELHFVSHVWSGQVRIVENGAAREIGLYDPAGGDKVVSLLSGNPGRSALAWHARTPLQRYVAILDSLLVGGLVILVFECLVGARVNRRVARRLDRGIVGDIVAFAVIPATASFVTLLLFFPGIMTSDSQDQWSQLAMHRLNDWHPPLHTLLEGALRIVWNSPAIVASCQALAMSISVGLLIALCCRATSSPRWAAYLGSALLACFPLVVVMTVTLWKDVFYTIAVVLLTSGTIAIVCFGYRPLRRPLTFLACLAVAVACLSFRHNGAPLVLATSAMTFWLAREQRKMVAAFLVSAIVTNVLVNGPVMTALGVQRVHIPFTIASHHIAAHLAAGETPTSESDRELIANIGVWKYNCATVDRTIFDNDYHAQTASAASGQLLGIAARMALASPRVEAEHLACVSSLVWRIGYLPGEPLYLSTTGLYRKDSGVHWIGPNDNGIDEASPMSSEGEFARSFLEAASRDAWWNRPAIFLYALLFACAVAARRCPEHWRIVACIAVAASAQSISLIFFNVAQDARYQLPIYVLALAVVPCLLAMGHRRRRLASLPEVASSGRDESPV